MHILMVCHAAPCSPAMGPAQRHLGLFNALSRRHRVSVITLCSDEDRERFEQEHRGRYERAVFIPRRSRLHRQLRIAQHMLAGHGHIRHAHDERVQAAMDDVFATTTVDAVYVSTVLLGCYSWPSDVASIGDAHNVEHEVFARISKTTSKKRWKAYCAIQARLTERDERTLARRFSAIWATSDRDAAYFAAVRGDRRVFVVPNGVQTEKRPDGRRRSDHCVILYVGIMSYRPNVDAAEHLIDDILPLVQRRIPSARVRIVGPGAPRSLRMRAGPSVEMTGWVPDVAPHYRDAAVLAVPLLAGGGTRLKVLEAMQHHVPVVSTAIGCEGLDVRHDHSVLIAETNASFADAVVRLWREPDVASRLTGSAAALVQARYDWQSIGRAIDPLLEEIVTHHAHTRRASSLNQRSLRFRLISSQPSRRRLISFSKPRSFGS